MTIDNRWRGCHTCPPSVAHESAGERSKQLLANGEQPPLMFYLIWSDYTRLARE